MALVACLAACLASCGASQADIRAAKSVGYDADFAIVYGNTLAAVRALYPHVDENAAAGVIKTAWHPVRVASGQVDPNAPDPSPGTNPFSATQLARREYFIRFTVYVSGGDPWRVRVVGQASEWEAGAVPVELYGANEPHWLKGRTEALEVAIYSRLKRYAVKLDAPPPDMAGKVAEPDRAGDGAGAVPGLDGLPEAAARAVLAARRAAADRDFTALGAALDANLTWSLGAPPGADQALLMWQADPGIMDRLIEVIDAGCAANADKNRVTCPAEVLQNPGYTGWRAAFAPHPDGTWKLLVFVSGD